MGTLIRCCILVLLLCASVRAQETGQAIEVGTGPICDTPKQVERLAALYERDAQSAVRTVNAEEHDPSACGIARLAFLRGARIATVRTQDAAFEIVEVLVVGIVTPAGFLMRPPAVYFSLFKIDERPV
jgi:hypothetical protein